MERSRTDGVDAAGPSSHVATRHRRLLRRTALVSGLTLASRVLGFGREVLSAILFGNASGLFDAFLTAWRVPNLFRRFFGEGALSTSLQTALTEADADRGDDAGRDLFLATLRVTTGVLVVICAVASALLWFAPGLAESGLLGEPEGAGAAIELAVRVLPFLVLVCLAALVAGGLQVRGHFLSPALAPVAMNLVWIATLAWIALRMGDEPELDQLRFLALGVVVAGAAQLAVQLPALRRRGLVGSPRRGSAREGWAVLRGAAPFALGAAAYQVNVLVDGLMAEALLSDGGPTAHYYANRVQQLPLALIAVAATASVFPSLKALGHLGQLDELRALHDRTQLGVLFLALPAAAGLAVLAEPIARALFEHGAFEAEGTARVASALRVVALALPAAGAIGLSSRLYYARSDVRTPVRISIGALALNTGLNFLFLLGLGLDVEGLAWATVLSSWLNWWLLLALAPARLGLPPSIPGFSGRVAKSLVCALACALGAWASLRWLSFGDETLARELASLASALVGGVAALLGTASALRVPELRRLLRR